jgi:hypothetical protein
MDTLSFSIISEDNYIKTTLVRVSTEKTSYSGGYDAEVLLEMKCGSCNIKTQYWTSTGAIYLFYKEAKQCNDILTGSASYASNYEGDLTFTLTYLELGHIKLEGRYQDYNGGGYNEFNFEFETDQSYMQQTLAELKTIVDKYGDMRGEKVN